MRTFLLLWLTPGALFWGWHLLSVENILFSRAFHDQTFEMYGFLLGVAPAEIPAMFAKAFMSDSLLVLAILAFRKRQLIAEFAWRRLQAISTFR